MGHCWRCEARRKGKEACVALKLVRYELYIYSYVFLKYLGIESRVLP